MVLCPTCCPKNAMQNERCAVSNEGSREHSIRANPFRAKRHVSRYLPRGEIESVRANNAKCSRERCSREPPLFTYWRRCGENHFPPPCLLRAKSVQPTKLPTTPAESPPATKASNDEP
ncbi:hypothetical protein KI387_041039, partial [Taxus chinensis]